MKKRVILAWLLLSMVVSILAGCAGGETPVPTSPTTTASTTPTPTPTPTTTPKPTTTVTPTPTSTPTPPTTTTTSRPSGWLTEKISIYPPARFGHAMTMLPDGRILMFGGVDKNGAALKDTWIFGDKVSAQTNKGTGNLNLLSLGFGLPLPQYKQPKFADWSPITPPDSPSGRQGHTMVTLPDGRVLLYGGTDNQGAWFNDLHTFDANKWSTVKTSGTPPPARSNHDAWINNNKMYVQGGIKDAKEGTATLLIELWALDLKSLAWAQLPKPPDYISPYGSPFIIGNKVYLLDPHRFDATGGTVQVYDMDKNLWEQKKLSGDYPHGERAYYSMAQVGSNAYTMGGQIWDPASKTFKDSKEVFVTDLTTFITKKLPDLPNNFNGGAVVYDAKQNRMVAWGGKTNQTDLIPGDGILFYNLPN